MSKFNNKNVIVTGGARGIGLAIAKRFLTLGADVHIFDRDISPDSMQEIPECATVHSGDVTEATDVENVVAKVAAQSETIDVLVNNAGIVRDNVIWRMPEKDFDAVLEVNLKGPWLTCRTVAPYMRKQNYGRIVNISSRSWLGNFGQSNYSASKGGLVSLTRVLALELAKYNVTVNTVAPGLIDTPMTRALPEETFNKLVEAQPGKKPGQPEDIAAAVTFLASEDARFITGQVLHVDGGKSIGAGVV